MSHLYASLVVILVKSTLFMSISSTLKQLNLYLKSERRQRSVLLKSPSQNLTILFFYPNHEVLNKYLIQIRSLSTHYILYQENLKVI